MKHAVKAYGEVGCSSLTLDWKNGQLPVISSTLLCKRILSGTTNKMLHYTVFFITANALHVSGCFSAHHQEFKNCTHTASGICHACLLLPLAVASCWLCLKEYINDAQSHECQILCKHFTMCYIGRMVATRATLDPVEKKTVSGPCYGLNICYRIISP
jgi:hypothetical protein